MTRTEATEQENPDKDDFKMLYIDYMFMCQWGVPGGSIQRKFTPSYRKLSSVHRDDHDILGKFFPG